MTIVVAYTAQDSGTSALELASVLGRSTGEPLVVAVVVTTPHAAGVPNLIDGDHLGLLTDWGQSVLDRARGSVPGDIEATFEVRQASSIPGGLLKLAADTGASALVLGSTSTGSLGRISLGSVTDRLVHEAPLPVLLAPRGFRSGPTSRIRRVNISFGGSSGGAQLATVGVRLAETFDQPGSRRLTVEHQTQVEAARGGHRLPDHQPRARDRRRQRSRRGDLRS